MCETCNCRDRVEKGVPHIEVTPEMIEAGVITLDGFGRDYGNDYEVIAAIFRSMVDTGRGLPRNTGDSRQ